MSLKEEHRKSVIDRQKVFDGQAFKKELMALEATVVDLLRLLHGAPGQHIYTPLSSTFHATIN